MNNEMERPGVRKARINVQLAEEKALAAEQAFIKANEAESVATREVEIAQTKASEAATELKNAIEAEVRAKEDVLHTRQKAKQSSVESQKAEQAEALVKKAKEQKDSRLKTQETKVVKAEQKGKQPDQAALDRARSEVDEADNQVKSANREVDRAKEALVIANHEAKLAVEKAAQAVIRVKTDREVETTTKTELVRAQDKAKAAAKVVRKASAKEVSVKKDLEQAIRKLKSITPSEAIVTKAIEIPSNQTGHVYPESEKGEERFRIEGKQTGGEVVIIQPSSELYSGPVRLQIVRPVEYVQVKKFQERLEQIDGLVVKSIGGSSIEGPNIIIVVEQPIPLLTKLSELDLAEQITQKGKDIEIKLRHVD